MRYKLKKQPTNVLFIMVLGIFLLLASVQACGADPAGAAGENRDLVKKLLFTGCFVGLVVVVILVATQVRGTRKETAGSKPSSAKPHAAGSRTTAFRCHKCGRAFRAELTRECKVECPLCGHVWQWPPPMELRLLEDRMSAFALDPENPRGDLTFATKLIARLSKSFAERMLIAGKYLEGEEILCICEACGQIHIAQKKNRGLLAVCFGCKSVFLIW